MPRKRMIDPSIWTDENFGELSERGRLLFIGLFSMADDEGRGEASAKVLKGKIFPYDEGLRIADVSKTLKEIGSKMSVDFYARNGREYYALRNWKTWQKVEKPTPSRIPAPIDGGKGEHYTFGDNSPTVPRILPECSTTVPRPIEQNRIEEEKNRSIYASSETPTPENVVVNLILNNGKNFGVTQGTIDELAPLYPAVDVLQELRKMQGWLLGNPRHRKTANGIMRFVTAWLGRAQDGERAQASSFKNDKRARETGTERKYTAEELNALFDNLDDIVI